MSLRFAEGRTVIEVACQAGHSPTMVLATYGHVIEELEGAERRLAEDVIREARISGNAAHEAGAHGRASASG